MKIMDSMSFSTVKEIQAHDNKIQCLSYNLHQTFLLSASTDHTCKMWDLETWDCVKTYRSDRPLTFFSCVLSHQRTRPPQGQGRHVRDDDGRQTRALRNAVLPLSL